MSALAEDTRVVNQHIDTTISRNDLCDKVFPVAFAADVQMPILTANLLGNGFAFGRQHVGEPHARAFGGKHTCLLCALAPCRTRDEANLVIQPTHNPSPLDFSCSN